MRYSGRRPVRASAALAAALALVACHRAPPTSNAAPPGIAPAAQSSAGAVDAKRLAAADTEPGSWLIAGRDLAGDYHSSLAEINASNVAQLGFAWEYRLGTHRGLEATPLMVDGVLYFTGNFGRVYALDAATGKERWIYDPEIDGQWGRYACCDAVNRGVAAWQGRIYVGALDGYLHAIDAATGKPVWKTDTLPVRDAKHPFTVSGTPVVAGDSIVIGSGGADFAGARGYVAAFDLATGHLKWRFYTVPRDPKEGPQDQPHLTEAVKTWDPRHPWEQGSGGTVWDGIAYDPQLKLVYIGTANGAPYDIKANGRRGGDDLYAASIIAVRADTGELVWWYQTTPGDAWDFDSTQKMVFADLDFGQGLRPVLMQANKNGFLYVLDRHNGEFLAAHPFASMNWTSGLDPKTHRPKLLATSDYSHEPRLIFPGASGAHNWQPMSFDPKSKRLFIPAIEQAMVYIETDQRRAGLVEGYFTAPGIPPEDYDPVAMKSLFGPLPPLAELEKGTHGSVASRGVLRALDPATGKMLWEVPSDSDWDGGVLSTDGNLVFQGDAAGNLNAYAADSGKLLAKINLGTTVMAAPATYTMGGTQYVAVLAGYGGGNLSIVFPKGSAAYRYGNEDRLIGLKLGGGAVPKPSPAVDQPFATPPERPGTRAQIKQGEVLYNRYCSRCHVFGRGVLPDLRRMSAATNRLFYDIVLQGLYGRAGMARWDDVLSPEDAQKIRAYILDEAWTAYGASAP
jgi:quinohemoprotein ethanol dehydrogenase